MSNITAKTSTNIFYQARCKASAHNEQLSSREGAADIMSIDRGRLYRIESGLVNPYPEEIHLMADLYNAPELRNFYCRNCCPLGENVPEINATGIDRITIKALASFRKIGETKELLLSITEDGVISEDEKPELDKVLKNLEELETVSQNLRVWIKKNLSGERS
ncbi:MAG: XRE family transcriptional regulator [Lachnospiraceae bacterium]|nr:XRE family transcriptional regulator [Lachnospiraceae bacterium]